MDGMMDHSIISFWLEIDGLLAQYSFCIEQDCSRKQLNGLINCCSTSFSRSVSCTYFFSYHSLSNQANSEYCGRLAIKITKPLAIKRCANPSFQSRQMTMHFVENEERQLEVITFRKLVLDPILSFAFPTPS